MATILNTTFSALKHRNYRLYWIGQGISSMGVTMQQAALAWLVYKLTGSSMLLATLGLFQFGPLIALALPAGVFADRWPKRRVLLVTQSVFLLQSLTLAVLTFSGRASYQLILLLAALSGIAQAFDSPSRRSFIMDLVGKQDLMNAISLNSVVFSVARILGPTLAGIAMAKLGGGWCFLLNALGYTASITALLNITVGGEPAVGAAETRMGAEMLEGLRYIWQKSGLRLTIIMATAILLFGLNYNVIIPVFADRVLNMGPEGYGNLLSALGAGALVGAVIGATVGRKLSNIRTILLAGLAISLVQIVLSRTDVFAVSVGLLVFHGCVNVLFANSASSLVQSSAEMRIQGRVMSVYALVEMGTLPAGNAFAGAIMDQWGASMGWLACGGVTLAVLLAMVATQRDLRRSPVAQPDQA